MRHGGGSGGGGGVENVTTQVGATTAIIPFIAACGLVFMPMRWPAAFRQVIVYAFILMPVMIFLGDGWMTSVWGEGLVLWAGWHISHKYMTPRHYNPSPRKIAAKQRQMSELTKYDHLRQTTTWNETIRESK